MSDPRLGSIRDATIVIAAALLISSCASLRENRAEVKTPSEPATQPDSKMEAAGKKAGEIATQPARDIGIGKAEIPPVLAQATEDPYSLKGLKSCKQLTLAIQGLNDELGPDFEVGSEKKENRAGKLAEAGGKTVINSLIPFRVLVREISGAAPAKRRLDDAIDAGFARRGFLRGVHRKQGCRASL